MVVLGQVADNKHATALYNKEQSIITLDSRFVQHVSTPALTFVFYHECGHITYQDTYSGYTHNQEEVRADCYAAKRYTNEYGRRSLHQVLHELLPINGYWRNQQILNCK